MTQTINVTAGDVDYATARMTERHGKPLTDTTWKVGIGGHDLSDRPTDWKEADLVVPVSESVVLVSMLINDSTPKGTGRCLWVLAGDAPTERAYRVGNNLIDII